MVPGWKKTVKIKLFLTLHIGYGTYTKIFDGKPRVLSDRVECKISGISVYIMVTTIRPTYPKRLGKNLASKRTGYCNHVNRLKIKY